MTGKPVKRSGCFFRSPWSNPHLRPTQPVFLRLISSGKRLATLRHFQCKSGVILRCFAPLPYWRQLHLRIIIVICIETVAVWRGAKCPVRLWLILTPPCSIFSKNRKRNRWLPWQCAFKPIQRNQQERTTLVQGCANSIQPVKSSNQHSQNALPSDPNNRHV